MNKTNKSALYGSLIGSTAAATAPAPADAGHRTSERFDAVPWSLVAIACAIAVALLF